MRGTFIFALLSLLVLLAAGPVLAATVAIGQLNLGYNVGWQVISFNNFTGVSAGCQVNGPQYSDCTGVDVTSWVLTLRFTNENPGNTSGTPASYGFYSSPYVINSGPSNNIAPGASSGPLGGYSGGSTTWQIPLDFQGAGDLPCPPCDYQLTQVEFSGTISATDLPFKLGKSATYNGSNASTYTIFNARSTFDQVWDIPSTDYTNLSDPSFFGDPTGTDVLVSDQPSQPPSSVPEPSSLVLCGVGLAVVSCWKRSAY